MPDGKLKEMFKGAIIGSIITLVIVTAIPVIARVAQETITVNFNNIQIAVNGQPVQTEYEPFIFQGRTYLPVRDVADAIGFDVTWEDATNTVHLTERTAPNLNVVPNYPAHQPAAPPQTLTVSGDRSNRPANPAISLEQAIEIAYADLAARGINATFRSDSGMDWERGQWVWELLFSTQGERMPLIEFYINVDDGNIVKFEWDD
jgi:uncharacterized membrane protein YkoI